MKTATIVFNFLLFAGTWTGILANDSIYEGNQLKYNTNKPGKIGAAQRSEMDKILLRIENSNEKHTHRTNREAGYGKRTCKCRKHVKPVQPTPIHPNSNQVEFKNTGCGIGINVQGDFGRRKRSSNCPDVLDTLPIPPHSLVDNQDSIGRNPVQFGSNEVRFENTGDGIGFNVEGNFASNFGSHLPDGNKVDAPLVSGTNSGPGIGFRLQGKKDGSKIENDEKFGAKSYETSSASSDSNHGMSIDGDWFKQPGKNYVEFENTGRGIGFNVKGDFGQRKKRQLKIIGKENESTNSEFENRHDSLYATTD